MEHPHIASIDCEDCSQVLYDLNTGERKLNGGDPIPVSHPPCHYSKTVCPKVKPGHSDLSADAREILTDYRYYQSIGRWPDDPYTLHYKVLLDRVYESAAANVAARHRKQEKNTDPETGLPRLVIK